MNGFFALFLGFASFMVPLAIPLFVQRWRSFAIVMALAVAFFWWLNADIAANPGGGAIGAGLGGLMLVGFGAGAIAKFVMLVSRR